MDNQFDEFDLEKKKKNANFGKKNAAGLIDAAIYIAIYMLLFLCIPRETWGFIEGNYALLFILLTFIAYRLICLFMLDKTIGMKILKLEFSKEDESNFSFLEKILAAFMIYINGIDCWEMNAKTEK
ncbi:MAG TPA: RDD family protein [Flavobacterium sp.]|nr:RDD family protein [Flavobacterium sp.]